MNYITNLKTQYVKDINQLVGAIGNFPDNKVEFTKVGMAAARVFATTSLIVSTCSFVATISSLGATTALVAAAARLVFKFVVTHDLVNIIKQWEKLLLKPDLIKEGSDYKVRLGKFMTSTTIIADPIFNLVRKFFLPATT